VTPAKLVFLRQAYLFMDLSVKRITAGIFLKNSFFRYSKALKGEDNGFAAATLLNSFKCLFVFFLKKKIKKIYVF
jgi:hypothetical protein